MDLRQLRKLNLEDRDDLKTFIKYLTEGEVAYGPANMSLDIIEMLSTGEEVDSAKIWFPVLFGLTKYFMYSTSLNLWNKSAEVLSRINVIESIIADLSGSMRILPHMKNVNKWAQMFLSELPENNRVMIYAMDIFLGKKLSQSIEYITMSKTLKSEPEKIRIATNAYLCYIQAWIKD